MDEGVEHFYLIDNGSTDNYESIIKKYMNKITLVKDSTRFVAVNHIGTQQILENKYFLDKVKNESKWVFICDIDEYLYNSRQLKILDYLNKVENIYEYIMIPYILFGSNLINTPNDIPTSLIQCQNIKNINENLFKTILKTNVLLKIDCHNHLVKRNIRKIKLNYNDNLLLNHYQIISKSYYHNIRCVRGGGVHGPGEKYSINLYNTRNNKYSQDICEKLKDKKYLK